MTQKQTRLALCAVVITVVAIIATIVGCGGNNNPGGGDDRFTTFTLTTGAEPAIGGTVSREPHATSYQNGTNVTLTVTPATGYQFVGWSDESIPAISPTTITIVRNTTLTALFEPIPIDHHTLTVNANPAIGGMVSRNPDAPSYTHETEVTVTAAPAEGYRFINWSGASTSEEAEVTVIMNSSMTLTANFELIPPESYSLEIVINPAGSGTVSRDPNEEIYLHGTEVTLTATPNQGYVFTGWTGTASTSTEPEVTVTVTNNMTLTANFELKTYTLTTGVSSAGGGTVSRDPNQTEYTFGTQVIITATPLDGYMFVGWSGALTSANLTEVITKDNNKALIANFQPIPVNHYTLAIYRIPVNGGHVSRSPEAASYAAGTSVTVTAEPAAGHTFIGWSGASTTASPSVTITMNTNTTLTASFQLNTYTLTTDITPTNSGTVRVNDVVSTGVTTHNHGTLINISAVNNPGYRFVNWTLVSATGTATFTNANNANTTVTLSSNATIRANFQQIGILTIDRNPIAGGTVTPASGQSHDVNTPVSITATVASGYRFVNWTVTSGTATFADANNAATTVTLSSNATIRANFVRIFTLTISSYPTVGGTFTPASGLSHDANTPVSITAIAASGYRFVNWTVTSASGTATIANANNANTTVTLSSNATIRANFEALVTLTVNHNPTAGGIVTPTLQSDIIRGTTINILATAASGYRFFNWTVTSGTATFANARSAATTVSLSSNATIRANFHQAITDQRDGRVYRIVTIGIQTWMAENLNWAGDNGNLGACYANSASNCNSYGRLYDWNTVMNGTSSSSASPSGRRGICPAGWHVPSDAEWTTLTNIVGSSNAGTKLKSTTGWHTGSGYVPGTDDFGFSALPGGYGWSIGFDFYNAGNYGSWWSATEGTVSSAWNRYMYWGSSNVYSTADSKMSLYSVRCLRDD
ncbi:MAG: InlB B-repeat-containing protein [Chitinispirillales bacterium]|jgi:uncharacterized protein (TIGR02145 family)/uncharacterized repeat protein (TIGR02543 family)|nr:InlB B-repeat-containing protein [Chitinispirillales bacterium]